MWNTSVRTLLISNLALIVALGCDRRGQVEIGAVLPLSGKHQVYGEASRKGLELALKEMNTSGDTRWALKIVDSASDPKQARDLLGQLYEEGMNAAIGGVTTDEARMMAPTAERFERVLLSPSAALRHQIERARFFFSLAPQGNLVGTTMATFAARRLGISRVVLIHQAEVFADGVGEGFRGAFETQKGELLAVLEASARVSEVASVVAEAISYRPDAVYLAGHEAMLRPFIEELRQQRFSGDILTTQALANPESLSRLGDKSVGVLLTCSALEEGFRRRYQTSFGELPGITAAESYDALKVLSVAMGDRPALPSEVYKGLLHGIRDFPGVTGILQFDDGHSVAKIPRVYSVGEDLALRDHGEWLDAEAERIKQRLEELRREMAQASFTSPF